MKYSRIAILLLAYGALVMTMSANSGAQKSTVGVTVPKYDSTAEATFKGTVEEVKDRECPMSGGMGSHLMLKLSDGKTIEVHLAATKFVKEYEMLFHKGDVVEVVGTKVQFEGVQTIFARQATRGDATFTFRDKDGTPLW